VALRRQEECQHEEIVIAQAHPDLNLVVAPVPQIPPVGVEDITGGVEEMVKIQGRKEPVVVVVGHHSSD
jgi:hypothetical protein